MKRLVSSCTCGTSSCPNPEFGGLPALPFPHSQCRRFGSTASGEHSVVKGSAGAQPTLGLRPLLTLTWNNSVIVPLTYLSQCRHLQTGMEDWPPRVGMRSTDHGGKAHGTEPSMWSLRCGCCDYLQVEQLLSSLPYSPHCHQSHHWLPGAW